MQGENYYEKKPLKVSTAILYSRIPDSIPSDDAVIEDTLQTKIKYSSKQWITLITLAFGRFCNSTCMSLQAPFFPEEAEKKGATPTEYGLIFGVFQLTIFIVSPFMTKSVQYIAPKAVLNCGILTVGVTSLVFGTLDFIEGRFQFVAAAFLVRIVEGLGSAAFRISSNIIIASEFSEDLGTSFATLQTVGAIGIIIGPTIGGALYDLGGYGCPFYTVGCIVILVAIVIYYTGGDVEKATQRNEHETFWTFCMHPTILINSLCRFSSSYFISFNQATLEAHIRQFHLSGMLLGLMFALNGIFLAATSPLCGWLIDKKCNSKFLCIVGCLFAIASLLLIGPAPFFKINANINLVIISLTLFGVSLGFKNVCAYADSMNVAINRGYPKNSNTYGLVSSVYAASQSLGSFVGPSLGGFLMEEFGYKNASMVLMGLEIILVCLLCSSFFIKN